jgi:hypothetical protein
MVHDRRIDGDTKVFGNASALYKNAMTFWDRETQSVWSQPTGLALEGERRGVVLTLLPSLVTTWGQWLAAYPHTLLMSSDLERFRGRPETFQPDYVVGLVLGEAARAYYYMDVRAAGIVNDSLGEVPVVVAAGPGGAQGFVRQLDGRILTFAVAGATIRDLETVSNWDMTRGIATAGPLQGQALRQVPSLTAFDWAWVDFYPQTDFYGRDSSQ